MSALQPICPAYTQGQTVSAAASAASTTIDIHARNVTITNLGAQVAYVRVGPTGVVATAADFPILSGAQLTLTKPDGHGTVSYISASGTSLHIIPGEGWR